MSWSERQRRLLGAMGVRLWTPPPTVPVPVAPASDVAVVAGVAGVAPERPVVEASASAVSPPAVAVPAVAPVIAPTMQPMRAALADALPPTVRPPAPPPAPVRAPPPVVAARADALPQPALSDLELAERAAMISSLAWAPLKDAVAACTACGLCASRRQTVFGVGHVRADWMIVGEAPGEQEDLAGEPFVGPAGQLLDQMLRAVGQSRRVAGAPADAIPGDEDGDPTRRVFIANTLKCRPPRNRNPEPEEMARCEPFLQRQLALVQPKLILAMGRFAVRQLLRSDDAIGKLRGRVHRYEGIPVVVTYHPAYLLRNLPDKAKAWEDLCLAKEIVSPHAP